jgi:DNA-binding CsgD family transcriptional regulator
MGLHLTHRDAALVGDALQALLAAPAAADVLPWWGAVEGRLRALFGGANTMITWPDGARLRFVGENVDADAERRLQALSGADPGTGLHLNHDPAVEAWFRYRRARRVEVWHETENFHAMERAGLDGRAGPFYNEGLVRGGFARCSGTITAAPGGEMFLTVGYDRGARGRFGGEDDAAVLRMLLPAVRAAHHALAAAPPLHAGLLATIDGVRDALLLVGADGRELHRNAALRAALAAEPARAEVEGAMRALAADLRALRRGAPPAALRPTRAVTTRLARHTLRATFAPAALWGSPDVVQVSLESSPLAAAAAPAEAPAAPAAPAALGLTAREAEVARLLARRASNAELAAALGVSAHTARHHTERVMRKLEVRKRADVAAALGRAAG